MGRLFRKRYVIVLFTALHTHCPLSITNLSPLSPSYDSHNHINFQCLELVLTLILFVFRHCYIRVQYPRSFVKISPISINNPPKPFIKKRDLLLRRISVSFGEYHLINSINILSHGHIRRGHCRLGYRWQPAVCRLVC